jgi:insulysin
LIDVSNEASGIWVFADKLIGDTEIAELKATTKADVLAFFLDKIHPTSTNRSKLSTHLVSSYSGVKFDMAAAQPMMGEFIKHGVPIDQSAIGALLAAKPDLQQVKDFAIGAIDKSPLGDDIKGQLKTMIDGLKGTSASGDSAPADGVTIRESNVYIEDIDAFKAGLVPSKAAMPVAPLTALAKL